MQGQALEFLLKRGLCQSLIDAIDKGWAPDGVIRAGWHREGEIRRKWPSLSARERDVCVSMLDGLTNKRMAERLDNLPDSVRKHRANV